MPPTILDHTQALFFGTGRLGRGGCVGSSWLSYRQGSTVSIVLGSTVSREGRELVESEVAAANAVVGTRFSMIVEQSDVVRPPMIRGRITVVVLPQAELEVVCPQLNTNGCAHPLFEGGFLDGGEAFYPDRENVFDVHEIGHLVGLCHVDPDYDRGGTMAAVGIDRRRARFGSEELEAMARVYAANLPPQAGEAEFRDRDLIPPL